MARSAVARERIVALRRTIARIEGTLPERLGVPEDRPPEPAWANRNRPAGTHDEPAQRRERTIGDAQTMHDRLPTGAERLDETLGGGLIRSALSEITSAETRNAGAAAGFALALAALAARGEAADPAGARQTPPVLWIGQGDVFFEAGFPHAPGATHDFDLAPGQLFLSETAKLEDALWIAEEAARLGRCAAVLVELRGNPGSLDLTATRRLHRRAVRTGRPVFLIREAAIARPTAAPLRLSVAPAASALRHTMAGAAVQSIGTPAFAVTIDKSRSGPAAGPFILEWNVHEHAFRERRAADPGAVVPASCERPPDAPSVRSVLAFDRARRRAG